MLIVLFGCDRADFFIIQYVQLYIVQRQCTYLIEDQAFSMSYDFNFAFSSVKFLLLSAANRLGLFVNALRAYFYLKNVSSIPEVICSALFWLQWMEFTKVYGSLTLFALGYSQSWILLRSWISNYHRSQGLNFFPTVYHSTYLYLFQSLLFFFGLLMFINEIFYNIVKEIKKQTSS